MPALLRSSFVYRLIGGFVLGSASMVAIHAATAQTVAEAPARPIALTS